MVLYAIVMAAYADQMYGEEMWDAITLWYALREDFNLEPPDDVQNKINAVRTAVETDLFYLDPEAFAACTLGMVEGSVDDLIEGTLQDLSSAAILDAIFTVSTIRGEEHPDYSPSVLALITRELREEAESPDPNNPETISSYLAGERAQIKTWLERLGVPEDAIAEI